MNTRQIEVFRTIMRCGTLTAAAQVLNASQPALNQILLHAERQLGFPLFRRLHGRLVPTPEAIQLFPEAERLYRDLDNFRRSAADLRHGKAGSLRLATSVPAALSFVPRALQRFRASCPGVRLISYVVPLQVIAAMLENGQADLGVGLVGTGHRLASLQAVQFTDLQDETLISYRPDALPGILLEQAFARHGARHSPEVEVDASIMALGFVQEGQGVAMVDGLVPSPVADPGDPARGGADGARPLLCRQPLRRRSPAPGLSLSIGQPYRHSRFASWTLGAKPLNIGIMAAQGRRDGLADWSRYRWNLHRFLRTR
jgi:DNA-binding transcriptional LysR family regulator